MSIPTSGETKRYRTARRMREQLEPSNVIEFVRPEDLCPNLRYVPDVETPDEAASTAYYRARLIMGEDVILDAPDVFGIDFGGVA